MNAEIFNTPQCLNMGFHYTIQFCRRTRVCVMGLVDQGSEEWERWYLRMHGPEAIKEIVDAGYTIIEIHFLYGFGLKGELEEWERTRIMVQNAHDAGLQVLGYFQFFSVQEETFFLENPWAKQCIQIDSAGNRIQYRYDRPALCFSDARVRQYYLDGVELGLRTCNLDGIRLDNDYYRGCYCPRCQKAFKRWLKENFDDTAARRIFGLSTLDGMSLAPTTDTHDPLWMATVKFHQQQRQDMMMILSERIREIKPEAILGGNPAIGRRFNDTYRIHVYPPDLGKTHHLVCAENLRFPARTGESTRHQVVLYKYGQSKHYAVFASHHIHSADGKMRWPESLDECYLSLCEALAFGGHPVTTTWGLRMDGTEDKTLYQRPIFRQALSTVSKFIKNNSDIYRNAFCNAATGIYQNCESLCMDSRNTWLSLQGAVQALLQHQIPFRFIDHDDKRLYDGLQVLVVPDVKYVNKTDIEQFHNFLTNGGKILVTGSSCTHDEWGLAHDVEYLERLWAHPNVRRLTDTPEKIAFASEHDFAKMVGEEDGGTWHKDLPIPAAHAEFVKNIRNLFSKEEIHIESSPFVAVDTFSNCKGERFVHLLNYDNTSPSNVSIVLEGKIENLQYLMPENIGIQTTPDIHLQGNKTDIRLTGLKTYCVICYMSIK